MSNHSYWRIYLTKSQGAGGDPAKEHWYCIGEVEMRATVGGADQCTGGTATAYDYYSATYNPDKAFDNVGSTWWATFPTPVTPSWLKYAFASAVNVAEVAITSRASGADYGPKDFQLQWSDDNTNWTTIGTWSGIAPWPVSTTRVYRPIVYAKNQDTTPYGLGIEVYRGLPYAALVATQGRIPFAITLAAEQVHPFDMPLPIVGNQAAMPFGITLAASNGHPYEGDIVLEFIASYDMTTRAASGLAQPFGVAITKGVVSPYAMVVSASLTTGYAWTVEKSLVQPYASQLVIDGRQPYSLTLAIQNDQSFAILFATNACTQPTPITLEAYHVQPWQVPVIQANTQRLFDTVCRSDCQLWSALWPVAQASIQSFDRTITVVASLVQYHDLLELNPVARVLTGSWDLSAPRPTLRLDGGVRAFHFGVSL